ncbi:alpha/beta fold hydrolase [Hymenobacter humi]|uniref:Alpha/beta fold hydrolase n=1 Tax=Hymenobacter humi TaxID=1411620 RepID=A0ABW2TY34_9BACT
MHTFTRILLGAALLALTATAQAQTAPASLTGDWSGSLGPIEFTMHLKDPTGGPRAATFDIPAQKVQGMAMRFTAPADSVYLSIAQPAARFAGRRAADGQQPGGRMAARASGVSAHAQPQRSYRQSGAAPPNAAAAFSLSIGRGHFQERESQRDFGRHLHRARRHGPVSGRGAPHRLGRARPQLRHRGPPLFAVIADHLTRQGFAVLRFDDRGVGQSGGTLQGTTSADYTADAQAALAWLRAQPGIRKNQVGLLGHSQGGTAAIGAAIQPQGPDFLVLLAAPALPGDEMLVQQSVAGARLLTSDAAQLAATEKVQRAMTQIIQATPDDAQARTKLLALYNAKADPAVTAQLAPCSP